jgi:serine/threonine protein kinase
MIIAKMHEKKIFPSIRRELEILKEIQHINGCIKLLDLFIDRTEGQESLSLVFPYYPKGDLYHYARVNDS